MSDDSVATLVGNLTRDPELRYTASGHAVVGLTLAVSRRWKKGNQWEEATSFIDVTCWRELAENVAQSCGKGDRVWVTGRLETQSWNDKTSGEKRSKVVVQANDVGPSLSYATCQIARTTRTTPEERSTPDFGGDEY